MALVNTKDMLKRAYEERYAVGAFNVHNMETIQGVISGCAELNSPVILQISAATQVYAGYGYLQSLIQVAERESGIPVAFHLDHGSTFEVCKNCIDEGFTSVMIDGSYLPFEKNVELTKRVVDYAHRFDVTVEGELGRLAGVDDGVSVSLEDSCHTSVSEVKDFVEITGVDSLAVAVGNSHGAYKFKSGSSSELRFDILETIESKVPDFPIVLHGASSISKEIVEDINRYGGNIKGASGIPDEVLKKVSKTCVCKINIDSDLRLAVTAAVRRYLSLNPLEFDPREYLNSAREMVKSVVKHKIGKVMCCANKA